MSHGSIRFPRPIAHLCQNVASTVDVFSCYSKLITPRDNTSLYRDLHHSAYADDDDVFLFGRFCGHVVRHHFIQFASCSAENKNEGECSTIRGRGFSKPSPHSFFLTWKGEGGGRRPKLRLSAGGNFAKSPVGCGVVHAATSPCKRSVSLGTTRAREIIRVIDEADEASHLLNYLIPHPT